MTIRKAILLVTLGKTMGPLKEDAEKRWPEARILTAYAGDGVRQELERLAGEGYEQGVEEVMVLPFLINDGGAYETIKREIKDFVREGGGAGHRLGIPVKVKLGRPLLWNHSDMERLAEILCTGENDTLKGRDATTIYVAHGTGGSSDERYRILERKFRDHGRQDILVATLNGKYGLEHLTVRLAEKDAKSLVLKPLMLTAGVHAARDLNGDGPESWKTKLTALGYDVTCEMVGLSDIPEARTMFLDHAETAVPVQRDSNPLEALVLTQHSLEIDETKILACRNMRQALMVQELQAQELLPECELEIVEGELDNVLAMIDEGEYTGVITSYADLEFFGLEHRARAIFIPEEILPGIGAGSVNLMEGTAMQGFVYELELGPESITSVYAEGDEDGLELWALYYDEETGQWWTDWIVGDPTEPELTGREFAKQISQGGQWNDGDWDDEEE